LAIGRRAAVSLLDRRDFRHDDFASSHPAGQASANACSASTSYGTLGDFALPNLSPQTPIAAAVRNVRKKIGIDTIVNAAGPLAGILPDGDLRVLWKPRRRPAQHDRRAMPERSGNSKTALSPAKRSPSWKSADIHIGLVIDDSRHVLGVVHSTNLWGLQPSKK